jgi:hypothetical protein
MYDLHSKGVAMTLRRTLITISLISAVGCRTTPTNSGNKDTTAAKTSAIDGLVLRGPISPVQRQGEPDEAPLAGAIIHILPVAKSINPDTMISAQSDSNGRFYVHVAPGTYSCMGENFGNSLYPRPLYGVPILVPANTVVKDTVHYDTGIR